MLVHAYAGVVGDSVSRKHFTRTRYERSRLSKQMPQWWNYEQNFMIHSFMGGTCQRKRRLAYVANGLNVENLCVFADMMCFAGNSYRFQIWNAQYLGITSTLKAVMLPPRAYQQQILSSSTLSLGCQPACCYPSQTVGTHNCSLPTP